MKNEERKYLPFVIAAIIAFIIGLVVFCMGMSIPRVIIAIVGSWLIGLGVVFFIIWVKKYKKVQKEKIEAKVQQFWTQRGYNCRVAVNEHGYLLLVDDKNGKWAVTYDDEIYDANQIDSVSIVRPYAYGDLSCVVGQRVLIHGCFGTEKVVRLGYQDSYKYPKNGITFEWRENTMRKIVDELTKLMEPKKQAEFAKANFNPTEEFQFMGQFFAYDITSKRFAVREQFGKNQIFPFSAMIDYYIEKDIKKKTKFDFGDALVGGIIGGKSGAAYWGKSSEDICHNLKLTIKIEIAEGFIDDCEFVLLDNGAEPTTSYRYQERMTFIDKTVRALKYIEKICVNCSN